MHHRGTEGTEEDSPRLRREEILPLCVLCASVVHSFIVAGMGGRKREATRLGAHGRTRIGGERTRTGGKMSQKAFTLYGIALSGPTYKVGLMLSLCGAPFAYRHLNLREGAHKTLEHLARNRFGQVPALDHGDLRLCQSGAILQYLAETLGKFGGEGPLGRQRAREWLFWDADRLSPGIFRTRGVKRGFLKMDAASAETWQTSGEQALQVLDGELRKSAFLAGTEPSIGDIACYGVIAFAAEGEFEIGKHPSLAAWARRIEALPGYKAPYDLLPMQDAA